MSVTPIVSARHGASGSVPPAGRSLRILVLDDDPAIGRLLGHIAKRQGLALESVTDEAAFRARYRNDVPDLVVLDLQIGASDGITQLRFLRDQGFPGGVILMSGFDARVLAVAESLGRELGLDIAASLEKPFRADAVAELLAGIAARTAEIAATDLPAAIGRGELFLEYQPVVVRRPPEILQFEALVRWQHPVRGRIPPDQFIPPAETEPEAIDALTDWVVATAAAQHRQLAAQGVPVGIAVNISARNLDMLDFPDRVAAILRDAAVPADCLCLEITETAASRDRAQTMDVLSRLRLKGMTLAIDDFGIGYSSLKALRQLPFSTLKIDRSFVADITSSRDAFVIVKSIADLARNMELFCIAEGVETEETAALLESLGVGAMQGYLIARPLPGEALAEWVRTWRATQSPGAAVRPLRA